MEAVAFSDRQNFGWNENWQSYSELIKSGSHPSFRIRERHKAQCEICNQSTSHFGVIRVFQLF